MAELLEFVSGIADGVLALIEFLGDMVTDTLYVVQLTGSFVASIPDYFAWLPPEVLAVIVSIFAIVVLYKILGRE